MIPSRRSFLMGAAALSAAVVTPDAVRAAQAMGAPDWSLATADVEVDVAPRAMRLISGGVDAPPPVSVRSRGNRGSSP